MRRLMVLGAVAIAAAGVIAGCDDDADWDPQAQFAPPLRPAFGARVVDGELWFWTGTPCHDVTEITVWFDPGTAERESRVLAAPEPGVTLERFRPTGHNPGFTVEEELPGEFDWREAESVTFLLEGTDWYWSASNDIDEVVDASDDYSEDAYLFQHVGWLDADAVAARNGESFLTPCTPALAGE